MSLAGGNGGEKDAGLDSTVNKLNTINPYNRGISFSQGFIAPRLHIVSLNALCLGGKANKAFDIALPTRSTNLLMFPVGQLGLGTPEKLPLFFLGSQVRL